MSIFALRLKKIHCVSESDNDRLSPADEVYALATAEDCKGNIQGYKTRVFSDVNSGQTWEVNADGTSVVNGVSKSKTNELFMGEIPSNKHNHRVLTVNIKMFEEDDEGALDDVNGYFDEQIKKIKKIEDTLGENPLENGDFLETMNGKYTDSPSAKSARTSSGEMQVFKHIANFFADTIGGAADDFISDATFIVAGVDEDNDRVAIIHSDNSAKALWYNFGEEFPITIDGGSEGEYNLYVDLVCYEKDSVIKRLQDLKDEVEKLLNNLSEDEWNTLLPGASSSVRDSFRSQMKNTSEAAALEKVIYCVKNKKSIFAK